MESLLPRFSSMAQGMALGKTTFPVLAFMARYVITQKLENIKTGQLLVVCSDGKKLRFGSAASTPVEIRVVSDEFWTPVLLFADLVCTFAVDRASSRARLDSGFTS